MPLKLNQKENLLAVILLLGVTFLIFWQFFLKGLYPFPGNFLLAWYEPWKSDFISNGTITISHKPIADDVFRQLYPFKVLAMELIKRFEWPLWNPYNGAGMPLLATMHPGYLNPFNIFFLFLPNYLAWSLHILIQPFLIGISTYLFCRKIGFSFKATFFSIFTFILSGFVIARLIFGEYIYAFSVLPLLLYLTESFIQNRSTRVIFFLPLAVFFLFISGHPQMIFYVLIFTFFYTFYRFKNKQSNLDFKKVFFLLTLYSIGLGLSAIQLAPTLELFTQSTINPVSSTFIFDRFLLPIQHLITILIPSYFGNQATYNYWGLADYIETIASVGLIPIFFAFLSFGGKKKQKKKQIDLRKFFLFTIFLTILSTLNWFGARIFFSLPLPLLSTGVPSRIFALTTFSIAILAGFGFDQWLTTKEDIKKTLTRVLPFILLIASINGATLIFFLNKISCQNRFIPECRLIALRNTLLETTLFFTFFIIFLIYLKYKKVSLVKVFPWIILTLIFILGFYNSQKFLPFSKKETFLPQNNLIKALQTKTLDGRVFGIGEANIKTDFASFFGFYDPNYYDPLYNKRYGELISYANNESPFSVLQRSDVEIVNQATLSSSIKIKRDRLLNLLNVKYLIYKKSAIPKAQNRKIIWEDDKWYLNENKNALPHAYLVDKFEVVKDDKELLKRLFDPSFKPQTTVLLEKEIPFVQNRITSLNSKVTFKSYTENKVLLATTIESPQILVFLDNYYPGWKAYIDGKETKIFRANYTFRAITVPLGNHLIEFRYEPFTLKAGVSLSIISFGLLIIIYFAFPLARKRR